MSKVQLTDAEHRLLYTEAMTSVQVETVELIVAARIAEALRDAASRLRNGGDGFQHETVAPYLDFLADEYDPEGNHHE